MTTEDVLKFHRVLKEEKLNPRELAALFLANDGTQSVYDLRKKLGCSAINMTHSAKKIEKAGYGDRYNSECDNRKVLLVPNKRKFNSLKRKLGA